MSYLPPPVPEVTIVQPAKNSKIDLTTFSMRDTSIKLNATSTVNLTNESLPEIDDISQSLTNDQLVEMLAANLRTLDASWGMYPRPQHPYAYIEPSAEYTQYISRMADMVRTAGNMTIQQSCLPNEVGSLATFSMDLATIAGFITRSAQFTDISSRNLPAGLKVSGTCTEVL
jgi:hypothetical protein